MNLAQEKFGKPIGIVRKKSSRSCTKWSKTSSHKRPSSSARHPAPKGIAMLRQNADA